MPLLGMGVQVPPRTPAQTPGSPPGTGGSRICGPHPSQPARGARWPRPHRVLPPAARSRPQATPGGAPFPPGAGSGRRDHPITTTGHPWRGAPSAGGGQWSPRPPDHDHRPPLDGRPFRRGRAVVAATTRSRPQATPGWAPLPPGVGSGRRDHPITYTNSPPTATSSAPTDRQPAVGGCWTSVVSHNPPGHCLSPDAPDRVRDRGWHSTGRATAGGTRPGARPRVALGRSPQPAT